MNFLELQVRVSGAGAISTEDECASSELEEDGSSLTEELSGFTEDEDSFCFSDEDEFSDFTEDELFTEESFWLDEESFALSFETSSSLPDEELLPMLFEICSSLSDVEDHTTRVESPQVILTPAFPDVLTVSFMWQDPCSVSSL